MGSSALKAAKVPFQEPFVFNNSALFVNPDKSFNGSMFWKMGKRSFDDFFTALSSTPPRSLQLTSEVLKKRQELELDILHIHKQIEEGTLKQANIEDVERIIEQNKSLIEANKNFTYKTKRHEIKKIQLKAGIHTTTCLTCNRTCHENCVFADNNDKYKCSAMTDGYCRECPNKCHWEMHKNLPYRFETVVIEEINDYENLKKEYMQAKEVADKKKVWWIVSGMLSTS